MAVSPVVTRGSRPLNKGRSGFGRGDWEPLQGGGLGPGLKLSLSLKSVPGGPHAPSLPSVCSPLLSAHFYPILAMGVCVCVQVKCSLFALFSFLKLLPGLEAAFSLLAVVFFSLPCLTCNINAWLKDVGLITIMNTNDFLLLRVPESCLQVNSPGKLFLDISSCDHLCVSRLLWQLPGEPRQ